MGYIEKVHAAVDEAADSIRAGIKSDFAALASHVRGLTKRVNELTERVARLEQQRPDRSRSEQ